jgi:hypothetical protein
MSSRDCNDCSNLLQRDGTSQKQRLFDEQKTDYVLVDERSYTDLIQFAIQQAEKIQFWDVFNRRSGDWVGFMQNSQASIYTEIVNFDTKAYLAQFDDVYDTDFTSNPITQNTFRAMTAAVFSLATKLDEWKEKLDDELTLATELDNLIQRQARQLINTLIAYDRGANNFLSGAVTWNLDTAPLSLVDYSSLSEFWSIDIAAVEAYNKIYYATKNEFTLAVEPTTIMGRGLYAKRNFRNLFKGMLDTIEKLKELAEAAFNELLTSYAQHQPHFALFLAFIQLFKHAQDHINGLTEKHLDFYYRDVLQLSEKAARPDSVHIIVEPAKNVDQKRLEAGTLLKAGKDDSGVEINFEVANEIVLNKAKIAKIMAIHLDRGKDSKYIQTIYSAEFANSQDGLGKEFTDPTTAWEPFGQTQVKDGSPISTQTMSTARVGFGIASPELLLGEGLRKVNIKLAMDSDGFKAVFGNLNPSDNTYAKGTFAEFIDVNNIAIEPLVVGDPSYTPYFNAFELLLADWFSIRLSGQKGWVSPDNNENDGKPIVTLSEVNDKFIEIEITLSREQDPIVPYSVDLHGGKYSTEWPILEVLMAQTLFTNDENPKMGYEFLKDLRIKAVKIDCDVDGVVDLLVGNDTGGLDAKKPFMPFTSSPQVGSNFYIGSREVFSKRLTFLNIGLDWKGVPESDLSEYYKIFRETSITGTNSRIVQDNKHFSAELHFLEDYGWKNLSIGAAPKLKYQSSELALKQPVATRTYAPAPGGLFFFLFAAYNYTQGSQQQYQAELGPAAQDSKLEFYSSLPPRKADTRNYVELFRSVNPATTPEGDARLPHTITIQSKENNFPYDLVANKTNFDLLTVDENSDDRYQRDPFLGELEDYKEGVKRGFIRLKLNNDFFHGAYPKILTERAIATRADMPSSPYTPELFKVSLNYKSLVDWETRVEQFYHITPFGEVEVFPTEREKEISDESGDIYYSDNLLPKLFKDGLEITEDGRQESKVDPDTGRVVVITLEETSEGALFIGLEDLLPPQSLSLLFQFKEGTENNDLEVPSVEWSYLSNHQWVLFESSEIVSDETNGLINSGIVQFSMPSTATDSHPIYGDGLHWIRVSISGNTEAFSDLISINAQAVKATYTDQGNDPFRLATEIAPESISKLVNKDFEIKTISQLYPSFDGRVQEQSTAFYIRVAERLRHKQRGITIRDYEHLVLEEFPEIYKTKCINHTSKFSEYAPGNVSVIVIPYFKNANENNPFELKVSKAKLNKIRKFLVKLNSPFVNLDVRNPKYESIQVAFGVEFHIGYDRTFYENQLNEEIKSFISPWAFGSEEDIVFGGKMNRSTILNFVEERPYVDYVTNFVMYHKEDENKAQVDVLIAQGTTASSVLVTALTHYILPANCDSNSFVGSGNNAFDHDSYNESYN